MFDGTNLTLISDVDVLHNDKQNFSIYNCDSVYLPVETCILGVQKRSLSKSNILKFWVRPK